MKAISKVMCRKRLWVRSLIRTEEEKATKPVALTLTSCEALSTQKVVTHSDTTFLRF